MFRCRCTPAGVKSVRRKQSGSRDRLYMPSNRVLCLFKFGERKHIDELVREGHLFMNTLKFFREREIKDLLRSDKHEGASHCMQAEGATLRMKQDDTWVDIGTIRDQILASDGSEEITNVFCMYAFREKAATEKIDPKNFGFGDTYAAVTDGDEFLRRVRRAEEREGLTLKHDLVEYVDRSTYNGNLGVFRKFSEFAYQSEFRISVVSGLKGPYSLRVGDLSDIIMTGNLVDLNERIRIEAKNSV